MLRGCTFLRRIAPSSLKYAIPVLTDLDQTSFLFQASFSKKSKKGSKHGKTGSASHLDLDGILSLEETTKSMEKALSHLKLKLANVRSGRATAGMLDHLRVQTPNSEFIPLRAFGTVTVKDARNLNISLFSPDVHASVLRALEASPLQLQVKTVNDQELTVALPVPTKASLDEMIKIVNKEGEHTKRTVRTARKQGMLQTKDLTSEDERKRGEKAVAHLTDNYIHHIDELCKLKVQDLDPK